VVVSFDWKIGKCRPEAVKWGINRLHSLRTLINLVGPYWTLLDPVGHRWTSMDPPGPRWTCSSRRVHSRACARRRLLRKAPESGACAPLDPSFSSPRRGERSLWGYFLKGREKSPPPAAPKTQRGHLPMSQEAIPGVGPRSREITTRQNRRTLRPRRGITVLEP